MQPEGQLMIYAHGAEIELSVAVAAGVFIVLKQEFETPATLNTVQSETLKITYKDHNEH